MMIIDERIGALVLLIIIVRVYWLFISVRHQRALTAGGAVEYGAVNSNVLVAVHSLYGIAAIAEAAITGARAGASTLAGALLFAFAAVIIMSIIRQLGPLWTMRLYIAPDHSLHRGWLFRLFRHPNYLLGMLPEYAAIALICQAWRSALVFIPLLIIILGIRIIQEERVMRERFGEY